MSATQDWPAADIDAVGRRSTIASVRLAIARRPWLPPVAAGAIGGVALAVWWAAIADAPTCFVAPRALGFGLFVLLALGGLATTGVGLAVASEVPMRRRVGKILMLGSLSAVGLFLVLTSILPIVIGPCPA